MAHSPIRIGILGAARIAPSAIIKPAQGSADAVIQAVAARSVEKATKFAEKDAIPHVAADYAALIARGDIDLIYNPLPPSAHVHWTIDALRAGKHVLCEKPFAMNAGEATQMVEEAGRQDRHLIEAFHYRFHPAFLRMQEVLPEVGTISNIRAEFSVPIPNRGEELRYRPELGGGALMDLGVYPIHFCRSLLGAEPAVMKAEAMRDPGGADHTMKFQLGFPSDIIADLKCSMKTWRRPRIFAEIAGEHGTLRITNFVAPHLYHKITLKTAHRNWSGKVKGRTTYDHQLQHVAGVLRGEIEPITGGEDAINTMRVVDAVQALAGGGRDTSSSNSEGSL